MFIKKQQQQKQNKTMHLNDSKPSDQQYTYNYT